MHGAYAGDSSAQSGCRDWWKSLPVLAVLGLVVLLSGCGARTSTGAKGVSTTNATPTPVKGSSAPLPPTTSFAQGAPLDWHPINTPPGFIPRIVSGNILVPSPAEESDPTRLTAYACDETPDGQSTTPPHPTFWATHDGGAHWAHIPLPASAVGWCNVYPDQTNAQRVLLGLSLAPPMQGPPGSNSYYISTDGGIDAQPVASIQGKQINSMETWRDTVYALIYDGNTGPDAQIMESNDGMRTWRVAAPVNSPVTQGVFHFWLDGQSGALIAEVGLPTDKSAADVYASNDGSQSWTRLPAPPLSGTSTLLASAGLAGQPWQLCAVTNDSETTTTYVTTTITCSTDGGTTWKQRASWTQRPGLNSLVLTPSGAIFGTGEATFGTAPSTSTASGFPVFEMAPFSGTWEQRGTVPENILAYSPTSAMLWALPEPMMGSPDPQGRIYVAHAS